jgi:hypothetical protein
MRTLATLLLLAGCGSENGIKAGTNDEYFDQAASNSVDILWVIDNSPSMQNEQESIAAGALNFIEHVSTSGMDYHIGVIDSDTSPENPTANQLLGNPPYLTSATPGFEDAFRAVVEMDGQGDDKERAFEAAINALSPPYSDTTNAGFLREDALLSVIFVSDENDCSDFGALGSEAAGDDCYDQWQKLTPVADIVRMFQEIKDENEVILSGVVGPAVTEGCTDSVPGQRFFTAIEMTGGVNASVCSTDYASVMDALGLVTSGILTKFQLEKNAKEETIEVFVNTDGGDDFTDADLVAPGETDGWTYITEYAQIEFHGTAIPPRGARIMVTYEIAAGPVVVEDTATTGG